MAYGNRLKKTGDRPMSLLDQLRVILEHSHNAYAFQFRCRGLQIVIEKMPDGSIVAYYADDRDGQVIIDTTQPPFDRISLFVRIP